MMAEVKRTEMYEVKGIDDIDIGTQVVEYNGEQYVVTVEQDLFPDSPREWDRLGTIVGNHRTYQLVEVEANYGETLELLCVDHEKCPAKLRASYEMPQDGYEYYDDIERRAWRFIEQRYCILPVYVFDHSGVVLSTRPFSCPWDSGQLGYIYVRKDEALAKMGKKKWTKKVQQQVESILEAEIAEFSQYVSGDVWCFQIEDSQGELIEMAGNILGIECCVEGVKEVVKSV